jgi:hypothetical protein
MTSLTARVVSRFHSLGGTTGERVRGLPRACLDFSRARLLGLPKAYLASPVVNGLGGLVARHYSSTPSQRQNIGRPKILILRNRYYSGDPNELSNEVLLLDNTLRASGLADFEVLTYDSDLRISPFSDLQLIRKCSEFRPDIVVFSSWWSNTTHPSLEAVRFVRRRLGIPVAMIWWDTCNNQFWPSIARYIEQIDLHIVAENPRAHCLDKSHSLFDRFLLLWSPTDPGLFYVEDRPRDIPVSFVGRATAYRSYRREFVQYLSDQGVPGHFSYSDGTGQVTHSQYAETMRRSQMCVNFSYSVDAHQLKGRVLEIMLSGALLLESENDQTSMLFKPMEDYVSFTSKEDLARKIHYFLAHPEELAAIAKNGTLRAQTLFSGTVFWESIFQKMGFNEHR